LSALGESVIDINFILLDSMKFLPCSWRTCDSVLRTFFTQKGVVNRVIYELPKHEDVHKHTKMRLVEKNGNWFVIADILKGKVTRSLAEDKD
jgi:hypothetical protein